MCYYPLKIAMMSYLIAIKSLAMLNFSLLSSALIFFNFKMDLIHLLNWFIFFDFNC